MDRNIDPTWEGHELAGELIAGLLLEFAERGHESFDEAQAARRMAQVTRSSASWLGEEHSARLAMAFEEVAASASKVVRDPFYQRLQAPAGLPGRTWYRNRLWAPGLETGYASEIFPSLRLAQGIGPEAMAFEVDSLILALKRESILR